MLIKLEKICKVYRDNGIEVNALDNVDLEICEGECVAIMGASGSGKSTLLNILGCMDKPSGGAYYLNDKKISDYSDKSMAKLRNELFGFVVQDFALIERDTVEKNVMLPLLYSSKMHKRFAKKERKNRVESILEQVGLLEKKKQLALKLSGGQRQRVAIARALVNDAEIILADEPTGALDQKTGTEIMDIFMKLNQEGKTIVVVTHDEKIAGRCGRVIEIVDGRIK